MINFLTAVRICFSKYKNFKGRASRAEFWYFLLFFVLAIIPLLFVLDWVVFFILVFWFFFIPVLAVGARRLHDIDRTGFWLLLPLLFPPFGWLLLLFFCLLPSIAYKNRYGFKPLALNVQRIAMNEAVTKQAENDASRHPGPWVNVKPENRFPVDGKKTKTIVETNVDFDVEWKLPPEDILKKTIAKMDKSASYEKGPDRERKAALPKSKKEIKDEVNEPRFGRTAAKRKK